MQPTLLLGAGISLWFPILLLNFLIDDPEWPSERRAHCSQIRFPFLRGIFVDFAVFRSLIIVIIGQLLPLWPCYLFSILSKDLDLFVALSIGHYQFIFELVLNYCSNFTFSAHCASADLGNEAKVCGACYFSDTLFDHIKNDYTSWRFWRQFTWDLSDTLRVAKPEKSNLCIADRCHQRTPHELEHLRWYKRPFPLDI